MSQIVYGSVAIMPTFSIVEIQPSLLVIQYKQLLERSQLVPCSIEEIIMEVQYKTMKAM